MAGRGGGGWGSSPTRLVAPTVLEEDGGGGAVPPPATRMPARCDRHYRPHPLALSVGRGGSSSRGGAGGGCGGRLASTLPRMPVSACRLQVELPATRASARGRLVRAREWGSQFECRVGAMVHVRDRAHRVGLAPLSDMARVGARCSRPHAERLACARHVCSH